MTTRREFLAWGTAAGAAAASGVIIPIAMSIDDDAPSGDGGSGGGGDLPRGDATVVPALVTTYPPVKIGSVSALRSGDEVAFSYPTESSPAALFKLGRPAAGGIGPDRDIVAFNTDCTHMGCPLAGGFNVEHGILGPCGCHFTTFDLTHRGMVVIGQATENLPQILLDIDGDDILAVGTIGIVYGFRDNLLDAELVEGI